MINLEWLRTFGSIYECNNITEASKKLNMTQPGVSKHLSALESHIGKRLFERTTRKLAPTEYGKFLYSQITTPLQQLEKVEYFSSQRAKKVRSALTIGCTSDFFKKELANKIYSFDMYIVTHFGTEKELIEALELDKIQLLAGVRKHQIYDHQFTFIKNETLELISSNDIEFPKGIEQNEKQLVQWLQKQTWFVYDNDQAEIKKFWETNFTTNPNIIPRYILPSYLDIIDVLKHTSGVSIVSKHLCEEGLNKNLIKTLINSSKNTEQKRYYSFKLKNSNLKEINEFIDKMEKAMNIQVDGTS